MSGTFKRTLADLRKLNNYFIAAEIIFWLHMIYKFHVDFSRKKRRLPIWITSDQELNELFTDSWPDTISKHLSIDTANLSLKHLVVYHDRNLGRLNDLPDNVYKFLLHVSDCHGRSSGIEKGLFGTKRGVVTSIYLYTVFGHLAKPAMKSILNPMPDFISQLKQLISDLKDNLGDFQKISEIKHEISSLFHSHMTSVLAETRFPNNDVNLWSQAHSAVSLFKPAIAYTYLKNRSDDEYADQMTSWRLFRVGIDILDYLFQAASLADLKARQRELDTALDKIKDLLELTYPIGYEVLRNEYGPMFVVIAGEDEFQNLSCGSGTIGDEIETILSSSLYDEIAIPHYITGEKSRALYDHQESLSVQVNRQIMSQVLMQSGSTNLPLCIACQVRVQTQGKPMTRGLCDSCLTRRDRRSQAWLNDRSRTIWMDEIADKNGRVSLIVGSFDIYPWVSQGVLETISVAPITAIGTNWDELVKQLLTYKNEALGSIPMFPKELIDTRLHTETPFSLLKKLTDRDLKSVDDAEQLAHILIAVPVLQVA
ncbi:MAG: hypothetical protein K9W43_12675 [Candidatus Thorarchaeota archaeon]|nr:hypothetical protein [Candidatus Thorarchaeota archaeon]